MKKVAIYGLSTETERELPSLQEKYQIVGLLDGFKTDGEIYSQPIISLDKAIEAGIELIIVVARPGSCKAIVKRIEDVCRDNDIAVFDIRGKDLLKNNRVTYNFMSVSGYTYEEIMTEINQVEAVSFDLFDTLVVRNTLCTTDVIEILNVKLQKKYGINILNFVDKRIAAEKKLSQNNAPRLQDIYREVLAERNTLVNDLVVEEFETDKELLIPRIDVRELLVVSKKKNKKVYITSDSYYSQNQIEEILLKNGITGYDEILVSCEYGTSKQEALFDRLKELAETDSILHIGDDIVSDIQSSRAHGLKSIQIYSAIELLDLVGGLGLNNYILDITDRVRVGMFAASIFNSPFQFEDEERRVKVIDSKDIGYLFCAPIISDFVMWFGQQMENIKYENVWFCARDGYLIKQLYEKMYPERKTVYFMTSRIAASRAGVETEKDVEYIESMKFSGEIIDNLKCRFGIDVENIDKLNIDESKTGLMKYTKAILKVAKLKKANNKKYIDKLDLPDGEVAFFDFVAKGTSQMFIQRLVSNHINGFYFLQLEPNYMKDKNLSICSFYTEDERDQSAIFDYYYILETLLTSPDPSLLEFDELGNPIYSTDIRSDKALRCIMRAQSGIIEYFETYLRLCTKLQHKVNKKLDEALLMLIHSVTIRDKDFLDLMVEDAFFNRLTDIKDIL